MHDVRLGGSAIIAAAVLACSAVFVGGAAGQLRATPKQSNPGNVAQGQFVFNNYFCAACHTLNAAGPVSHGILAALLAKQKMPYPVVVAAVTNGLQRQEYMPAYRLSSSLAVLTTKQIQDVAAFVAKYSGTRKACSECTAPGTVDKASSP